MCRNYRRSCSGTNIKVIRIGEAADVVADAGATLEAGLGHRSSPCIDRKREIESRSQRFDGGDHTIEFFLLAHILAGTSLHSANVEEISAISNQLLGFAKEILELKVRTLIVKRVRCSIENSHDDGAVGDVETGGAEV